MACPAKRDAPSRLSGAARSIQSEHVDVSEPVTDTHVFDVALTVLAALGIEPSDRMDGAVLSGIETVGERPSPSYGRNERRAPGTRVEERRSTLGYVDRQ